jgi:hypothetical protein
MATYQVVAWRDIPAAVEARDAGGTVTLPLSDRFQNLIDAVAVQLGLDGAEAYMAEWRRLDGEARPGTAGEVAAAVVAELEARFGELSARAVGRA